MGIHWPKNTKTNLLYNFLFLFDRSIFFQNIHSMEDKNKVAFNMRLFYPINVINN